MQIKINYEVGGKPRARRYDTPLNTDGWADGWDAEIAQAADGRWCVLLTHLPAAGDFAIDYDVPASWCEHLAILPAPESVTDLASYESWLADQGVVEIWADDTVLFEAPAADSGEEPTVDLDTGELVDVADLAADLDYEDAMSAADLDPGAF